MPVYEICHCIPLSRSQQDTLASFITHLHATTFATPHLFVNVSFRQPSPVSAVYTGGKYRGQALPNHIRATIRTGPTRSKEAYDEVGVKIQQKWDEVVSEAAHSGVPEKARKMHGIVFTPMVAAVEGGVVVPAAGEEGEWIGENMDFFRKVAETDEDVAEMLREAEERALL